MIVYLIEFAILHCLFLAVYKIFLAKETQLKFLRFFLLGSTLLSLVVPLLSIPSLSTLPTINLEEIVPSTESATSTSATSSNSATYQTLYLAISILFFLRVLYGLIQIGKFYKKSEMDIVSNVQVRRVAGIKNSFTFFRWIFIDPEILENPSEIITHESGHSAQLHSIDILFFNLLTIPFWSVPSVWMMIQELRKLHEFAADQFALKSTDQNNYIKTLVYSTLKAHGLNLASSFDDAPTVERLNFMKMMKKKVSPWKVGSIMAIVLISGAMFACESQITGEIQENTELESVGGIDEKQDEIFIIVDEPASYPGGLEAFTEFLKSEMKYPEQAQRLGVEGRVFVQFVVEKDGSLSDVIVAKGIGAGCDKEAVRVLEKSSVWEPGKMKGRAVRMKIVMPINFKLTSS